MFATRSLTSRLFLVLTGSAPSASFDLAPMRSFSGFDFIFTRERSHLGAYSRMLPARASAQVRQSFSCPDTSTRKMLSSYDRSLLGALFAGVVGRNAAGLMPKCAARLMTWSFVSRRSPFSTAEIVDCEIPTFLARAFWLI